MSVALALQSGAAASVWACFGGYLAAMIAIGLWAARRGSDDQEDFFLGGRRGSAFATALSAVSSGRSAWLVLGASAAAWKIGLSALWLFPGYVAVEAAMFLTLGPRLRERSAAVGALTVPEVLASAGATPERGSHRSVRAIAGLLTVLFLLTYVSAQLVGGGKAIESIFDIEGNTWGLLITAAVVLVYTVLGGYRAVVVTDVLQALLMLVGLLVVPWLGLRMAGGWDAMWESLRALDPALCSPVISGWAVAGGLAIGLGSVGNPHILVRHMSLEDARSARAAFFWGTSWNTLMAGGALLMGLVGRALYASAERFPNADADFLFPQLGAAVAEQYLFAGFAGVLLATLFAAVMSTCDSQLLVIASSIVRDFRGQDRPAQSAGLGHSRLVVALSLAIAVGVSFGETRLVHHFVLLSWGALGAAFGPAMLLALYDARTGRRAVTASMLVGVLSFAALNQVWPKPLGTTGNLHLVPAFACAFLAALPLRERAAG